jgi:hypothetical protein
LVGYRHQQCCHSRQVFPSRWADLLSRGCTCPVVKIRPKNLTTAFQFRDDFIVRQHHRVGYLVGPAEDEEEVRSGGGKKTPSAMTFYCRDGQPPEHRLSVPRCNGHKAHFDGTGFRFVDGKLLPTRFRISHKQHP